MRRRGKVAARAGSVFVLALSGLIGLYQQQLTLTLWVALIGSGAVFLWAWGVHERVLAACRAFVNPALLRTEAPVIVSISPQRAVLSHNYMRILDLKDEAPSATDHAAHRNKIYDVRGGLINSGLFSRTTEIDLGRDPALLPVDPVKATETVADFFLTTIRRKWREYS